MFPYSANTMWSTVKKHQPALHKTSKQPTWDESFDECSLWGTALHASFPDLKLPKNTTFPPPHTRVRENVLHSHASFCTSHTSCLQGCANTGQNVSRSHVGVRETQMFAFFFSANHNPTWCYAQGEKHSASLGSVVTGVPGI